MFFKEIIAPNDALNKLILHLNSETKSSKSLELIKQLFSK